VEYEAGDSLVRIRMSYLSESEGRTSESYWTYTTFEYSRVEVGTDWNGLYHRITTDTEEEGHDLGDSRPTD
jgi:hypothetical protein